MQALQKLSHVVCLPLPFSSSFELFSAAPLCTGSPVNPVSSPMSCACWKLGVCSALRCLLPRSHPRRPWVATWAFLSLLGDSIHWGEGSLTALPHRLKFLLKIFMTRPSFLMLSHSYLTTYLHCSSTNITLSYPQFAFASFKGFRVKTQT